MSIYANGKFQLLTSNLRKLSFLLLIYKGTKWKKQILYCLSTIRNNNLNTYAGLEIQENK